MTLRLSLEEHQPVFIVKASELLVMLTAKHRCWSAIARIWSATSRHDTETIYSAVSVGGLALWLWLLFQGKQVVRFTWNGAAAAGHTYRHFSLPVLMGVSLEWPCSRLDFPFHPIYGWVNKVWSITWCLASPSLVSLLQYLISMTLSQASNIDFTVI